MAKVKKTFRFSLHGKAADGSQSTYQFSEDMDAGIMAVTEVTYELEESEYEHPMFLMNLIEQGNKLRDQMVGMKVEAIADDGSTLEEM